MNKWQKLFAWHQDRTRDLWIVRLTRTHDATPASQYIWEILGYLNIPRVFINLSNALISLRIFICISFGFKYNRLWEVYYKSVFDVDVYGLGFCFVFVCIYVQLTDQRQFPPFIFIRQEANKLLFRHILLYKKSLKWQRRYWGRKTVESCPTKKDFFCRL